MTGHRLVVWYNTRCPVCDAGIDWQRNKLLQAVRAGHISFNDINEQPDALASYGASLDDVRRRLHATDEAGRQIAIATSEEHTSELQSRFDLVCRLLLEKKK